jgi:hypothetical protein
VVGGGGGVGGGGVGTDADCFLGCKCPLVVVIRTTSNMELYLLSCSMVCRQFGRADYLHHGSKEAPD